MIEHHRLALLAALTVLTAADLAAPAVVEAQDEATAPSASSSTMRFTLGLGRGHPTADIGATLGLAYERSGHVGAVRASTSGGIFSDTYTDVALLYGRAWRMETAYASISAGPGYVHIQEDSGLFSRPVEPESTVGVALAADLTYTPWRRFGLGAAVFGNINAKQTFGGVALMLSVGRLK